MELLAFSKTWKQFFVSKPETKKQRKKKFLSPTSEILGLQKAKLSTFS